MAVRGGALAVFGMVQDGVDVRVAEARGGIAKVARMAGIERESLYRALSAKGKPRLSTLVAVTQAVGLKLTVENARELHGPVEGQALSFAESEKDAAPGGH
jgi:hypothetical protein